MADQGRKRLSRGYAASRFDEITLAGFVVLLIVAVAAVLIVGVAATEDRIGCGLNDIINMVTAYPRGCH